jgi:hypothetical protein
MKYFVTYEITGTYTVEIEADSIDTAWDKAHSETSKVETDIADNVSVFIENSHAEPIQIDNEDGTESLTKDTRSINA